MISQCSIINDNCDVVPLQLLCEEVVTDKFHPVLSSKGSELVVVYDEHRLIKNFKFGVIYQRFGQVS